MTPRISVIGASIRKLFEAIGNAGDPYWDNVVLASHFDTKDDPIWNRTVLALHGNQADPYWSNVSLAMHMDEDIYRDQTVLGLHFDGANDGTTFTEINGKTVTRFGNVVTKTAVKKFGTSSAYFDGVGDALSVPTSSDYVFGTDDFTVELWFYPTNNTNVAQDLLWHGNDGNNTNGWFVRYYGASAGGSAYGVLTSAFYDGATPYNAPGISASIKPNDWNHIVVCRQGSSLYQIVNGVKGNVLTTTANFGTPTGTNPALAIGREYHDGSGAAYFTGYIDDVRITKGVARYTESMNVPYRAFPDVKWLDEKGKTVTPFGTMAHSTDYKKFGLASALFNGTDSYLSVPTSTDFEFGSGNFTIECYFRTTNNSVNQSIICHLDLTSVPYKGWVLRYDPTVAPAGLRFVSFTGNAGNESDAFQIPFNPTNGTFYHIVAQRQGNEFAMIVDGICIGTGEFDRSVVIASASTRSLLIGAQDSATVPQLFLVGNIEDLRITKGIARYPVSAPTGDPYWDNVVVSLHMNGTQGGTTFTDGKGGTVTRSGNTITATNIKRFGTTSAFFDGTGDYLTVEDNANLDLGNNFTIECWAFLAVLPTSGNGAAFCQRWNGGVNKRSYYFQLDNVGGTYQLWGGISSTGSDAIHCSGNFTPQVNQWVHYAFVYTGTELLLFANGNLIGTSSTSVVPFATDIGLTIGATSDAAAKFVSGYIEDFRITKAAKYRANFVPRIAPFPDVTGAEGTAANSRVFYPKTHAFRDPATLPLIADEKGKRPTITGSVSLNTTTKKFGDSSISFNGSTDYITYPSSTDFGFETGDFCIEFWMNTTDADGIVFDFRNTLLEPFCAFGLTSGKFGIWNGCAIVGGATVVNTSTWIHISAVRYRGYITVYVDGNFDSVAYIPDNLGTTRSFRIGADISGASFFAGYLDEFRVTKKASRYIGEFTPNPYPYLEPNNKPYFLEETGKTFTVYGDSKIGSVQKYGSGSVYFDGHNDFAKTSNPSFNLGLDDFTVEFWVKKDGDGITANSLILLDRRSATLANEFLLYINQSTHPTDPNKVVFYTTSIRITSTSSISNDFTHVAIVRCNGITKMYINGSNEGVSYSDINDYNSVEITVGGRYDAIAGDYRSHNGQIDDLRITKGIARYLTTFTPPQKAFSNYKAKYFDPYWDKVSLAMHMDGANDGTTFTDVTGKTVTRFGALTKTAVKKFGTASAFFDGVDDYLSVSQDPSIDISTGDFTIEFWFYPTQITNGAHIVTSRFALEPQGWQITQPTVSPGVVRWACGSSTATGNFDVTISSSSITSNQWYHVAATRKNNTFYLFLNGLLQGTVESSVVIAGNNPLCVGNNLLAPGAYFSGYLDELRITKGVARYTADFLPMQLPFPEKAFDPNPIYADEYFHNVVLGMHMDGGENGTTFTELTGKTVTRVGTPVTKTDVKKYGTSSTLFNGTTDYLTVPYGTDFDFGVDDFTVEAWIYPTALPASTAGIVGRYANLRSWWLYLLTSPDGTFVRSFMSSNGLNDSNTAIATSDVKIQINKWYHVALIRRNGTLHVSVNGVRATSSVSANFIPYDNAQPITIGAHSQPGAYFQGYIDDIRVTKGVARYTTDFTPPVAFPDSYIIKDGAFANTVLLMHMDGADNGTTFTDVKGKTVTAFGNVKTLVGQKKYGTASAFFDGNGDYLSLANSADWQFGTGDFTIEAWINPTTLAVTPIVSRQETGAAFALQYRLTSDGQMQIVLRDDNGINLQTYTTTAQFPIRPGNWSHVALTRASDVCRLFINGQVCLTVTDGRSLSCTDARPLTIGALDDGAVVSSYYNGYIDDLRITKGVARYTENFTPPRRHPDN